MAEQQIRLRIGRAVPSALNAEFYMPNHIEDLGAALHSRISFMANNLNVDRMEFIDLVYTRLGVMGPPPRNWHAKLRPDFWDSEIMEAAQAVCKELLQDRLMRGVR